MTARAESPGDQDPWVLATDDGPVRVLTLNDPARHNVMSIEMREALRELVVDALAEPSCRAIVLTGRGDAFCAGGDLSSMRSDDPDDGRARMNVLGDLIRMLVLGPKPVLAAVNGLAYGIGLSFATACDYIVASDSSRFCCSFGKVGLIGDSGILWSLPRRVGVRRARSMLLFNPVVTAASAEEWGLADEVVAEEQLMKVVMQRARELADAAPLAVAVTKRLIAHPVDDLERLLELEVQEQVDLLGSEDFGEGRAAFFARRDARFRGA
jgi:2-(1,2-epoxy-1,2-dihydrophenyl)acetyl-CoA isomerase